MILSMIMAALGAHSHTMAARLFPDLAYAPGNEDRTLRSAIQYCHRNRTVFLPLHRLLLWSIIVAAVVLTPLLFIELLSALSYITTLIALVAVAASVIFEYGDIRRMIRFLCITDGIPLCAECGYMLDPLLADDSHAACPECGSSVGGAANEKRSIRLLPQYPSLPILADYPNGPSAADAVSTAFERHPLIAHKRGRVVLAVVFVEVIALVVFFTVAVTDRAGNPITPQWLFQATVVAVAIGTALWWRRFCINVIRRELVDLLPARDSESLTASSRKS
jgi:hypothetical protein